MGSIADWVRELSLTLILAGVADLFLPETALKRTARLAVGTVVVALILAPLLKLVPLAQGSLAQGSLALDAPLLPPEGTGPAAAGRPVGGAAPGARDLTEEVFLRLLEQRVAVLAAAVDGVARVDAHVTLVPGDGGPWGRVGRVDVRVWAAAPRAAAPPSGSGGGGRGVAGPGSGTAAVPPVGPVVVEPVRLPPAGGVPAGGGGASTSGPPAAAPPGSLADRVAALLSRELGLPPSAIHVTVQPAVPPAAPQESSLRPAPARSTLEEG